MKIDRSTKIEDETGSTCELDVTEAGITIRTKNGKPFVLATAQDVDDFENALYDLKVRLIDREQAAEAAALPGADEAEPVAGAKVEKANPTGPAKAKAGVAG